MVLSYFAEPEVEKLSYLTKIIQLQMLKPGFKFSFSDSKPQAFKIIPCFHLCCFILFCVFSLVLMNKLFKEKLSSSHNIFLVHLHSAVIGTYQLPNTKQAKASWRLVFSGRQNTLLSNKPSAFLFWFLPCLSPSWAFLLSIPTALTILQPNQHN